MMELGLEPNLADGQLSSYLNFGWVASYYTILAAYFVITDNDIKGPRICVDKIVLYILHRGY